VSGVIAAVRCNFCSRQVAPSSAHRTGTAGPLVCDNCLDWHFHALGVLGGETPRGCQECGRTWERMQAESPAIEMAVRVFVVQKDGIYQMLCPVCAARYLPKRADLYQGTEFGRNTLKL
jgi:hypothetical protein